MRQFEFSWIFCLFTKGLKFSNRLTTLFGGCSLKVARMGCVLYSLTRTAPVLPLHCRRGMDLANIRCEGFRAVHALILRRSDRE